MGKLKVDKVNISIEGLVIDTDSNMEEIQVMIYTAIWELFLEIGVAEQNEPERGIFDQPY